MNLFILQKETGNRLIEVTVKEFIQSHLTV